MDDLEFRRRVFSDPLDDQADLAQAANTTPQRQRLLDDVKSIDLTMQKMSANIAIPDGLQTRLYNLTADNPADSTAAQAPALNTATNNKPISTSRIPYMLAASMVLATGLGYSVVQSRPNAADIALHDALVAHLHHEAPRYSGDAQISWDQVTAALLAAGAILSEDDEIASLHMTFANHCGLGGSQRGAHIVAKGEHGPVSIIFIKNTPVSTRIKLKDDRFKGQIIPMEQGNMAVIGEKSESLERFEKIMRANLQWSI